MSVLLRKLAASEKLPPFSFPFSLYEEPESVCSVLALSLI